MFHWSFRHRKECSKGAQLDYNGAVGKVAEAADREVVAVFLVAVVVVLVSVPHE